jgi:enterochelin esterase-like enzyme
MREWTGFKIKSYIFLMASFFLFSCTPQVDVNQPLELVWDKSNEKTRDLIIFLPGLYDVAEIFKEEQFFSVARAAGIRADMVAASVHLDHLLQKKVIKRIETDVYFPAMKTGYKNTWFVGVSLGGLNSLLFYEKYAEDICGVVLLAPYLGDKVVTNAIKKAGGIHRWEPDHIENPNDIKNKELVDLRAQNLWRWIKRQKKSNTLQNIYLGHGAQDRYAEAHKLLANFLDSKNVTVIEGKHEWKTGRKLWQKQLAERSGSGLLKPCR